MTDVTRHNPPPPIAPLTLRYPLTLSGHHSLPPPSHYHPTCQRRVGGPLPPSLPLPLNPLSEAHGIHPPSGRSTGKTAACGTLSRLAVH